MKSNSEYPTNPKCAGTGIHRTTVSAGDILHLLLWYSGHIDYANPSWGDMQDLAVETLKTMETLKLIHGQWVSGVALPQGYIVHNITKRGKKIIQTYFKYNLAS